jgi:hypothetical protein
MGAVPGGVHRIMAITVGSLAVPLELPVSPFPARVAPSVTWRGAFPATPLPVVSRGQLAPASRALLRVQLGVAGVQFQPRPLTALAVGPPGGESVALNAPSVGALPMPCSSSGLSRKNSSTSERHVFSFCTSRMAPLAQAAHGAKHQGPPLGIVSFPREVQGA